MHLDNNNIKLFLVYSFTYFCLFSVTQKKKRRSLFIINCSERRATHQYTSVSLLNLNISRCLASSMPHPVLETTRGGARHPAALVSYYSAIVWAVHTASFIQNHWGPSRVHCCRKEFILQCACISMALILHLPNESQTQIPDCSLHSHSRETLYIYSLRIWHFPFSLSYKFWPLIYSEHVRRLNPLTNIKKT